MSGISARLTRGNPRAAFDAYYRNAVQTMERAAVKAIATAGKRGERTIRDEMRGAGLGRLGQAIKATSDEAVKRRNGGGFSVSATLAIRTASERTRGAIASYTNGADIHPVRGRWLWIATDEIPRVTGRYRMTPELYVKNGFERKIGPLVLIRSVNGNPLLVAKMVGVNAAGLPRKARRLNKNGRPAKGQRVKEFVVAFVGIPRTSRAARVDVPAILKDVAGQLPELFAQQLQKEGKR